MPVPVTTVCSRSCFGAGRAGKVNVGLASKAPVRVIPVFPTTTASVGAGAPADVDVLGWLDEEVDPDEEWEPDEQAPAVMTAAAPSRANPVCLPRNRARASLPIEIPFPGSNRQTVEPNRRTSC